MNNHQAVVIGSGAGGAAFAYGLAKAGIRVQVLEAGPRYDPQHDYRLSSYDWEQQNFPAKVSTHRRQTHGPLQQLEKRWDDLRSWNHLIGRIVPSRRRVFNSYQHVIGVGGSTLHFSGEAHRMHPQAMSMHSRFGVAQDWPFGYQELEPWYLEAERLVGVAGSQGNSARPRSAPFSLPAHELSYASQVLGAGCKKLGLSWEPNSLAILSRPYDGRPPCNYCGQCSRGCPRLDKGSADITFLAKALATGNCTLTTSSPVSRLEMGANDRVKSAIYTDQDGQEHRVEAELFAVACGAVETPRLLLNSASAAAPDGLANESGLVGRNFMESLFWVVVGLYPEPLGSHRGLPSDAICWDYNAPDAIPGVIGGCRFSPATLESNLAGPISYAQRVVGGWGREHKQAMQDQFGRVLAVSGNGESLPSEGSFIDLDLDVKDKIGMPKARINSHLGDMELTRLKFIADKSRSILNAAGVEKLIEEFGSYDMFNSTHVFGTCGMGSGPDSSVVDGFCRNHRCRNLMVVDASVFPSSGGGEAPSLTISAIALRAAAFISKQRGLQ